MDIDNIYSVLQKAFDENKLIHSEFVDFMENVKNPYLVLICCILSLRTNDKITIGAAKRMLELAKTPLEMTKVSCENFKKQFILSDFIKTKLLKLLNYQKK